MPCYRQDASAAVLAGVRGLTISNMIHRLRRIFGAFELV